MELRSRVRELEQQLANARITALSAGPSAGTAVPPPALPSSSAGGADPAEVKSLKVTGETRMGTRYTYRLSSWSS